MISNSRTGYLALLILFSLVWSGSSPILISAVELSPAEEVPVTVSTAWTGPDSSMLMSATPHVGRHSLKVNLNYVKSADSIIMYCKYWSKSPGHQQGKQ